MQQQIKYRSSHNSTHCRFSHSFPSRQKSPGLTASTVSRKPEARTTPKSKSATEQSFLEAPRRAEKDVTTFLQKLRDAAQSKPSRWVETSSSLFCCPDVLLCILNLKMEFFGIVIVNSALLGPVVHWCVMF